MEGRAMESGLKENKL